MQKALALSKQRRIPPTAALTNTHAQVGSFERHASTTRLQANPLDIAAQEVGQPKVIEAAVAFELLASKEMAQVRGTAAYWLGLMAVCY